MSTIRGRREPPPFRPVTVARTEPRSPYLTRVTLTGDALEGLEVAEPAASVRLLLPRADTGALELPTWNGNEFLDADGNRPRIRTLTPLRFDPDALELDVEIVLHDDSPLTRWITGAGPGTVAAISGTGRGYDIDPDVSEFLLAGDETAVPAISTIVPELPADARVRVIVEVRDAQAQLDLPAHPHATIEWVERPSGAAHGDAMVDALLSIDRGTLPDDVQVWVAGEAAAVQRIRRHLKDEVGLGRSQATVRGYWKHGRAEGGTSG